MTKSQAFLDVVANRRTIYALNDKAPISDKAIIEIAEKVILNIPSSFNCQSARLVVLLKDDHKRFWDIVKETLEAIVPADAFPATETKLNAFKAGYGTILFFEDSTIIKGQQEAFAIYSQFFPTWSEHTSAMHQFVMWTALEAEGFGANLQHYIPIADEKVHAEWKIPKEWQMKAQLVFGGKVADAGEKKQTPLENRLIIHGA